MTTLGQILLAIAAVSAFASIGSLAWGHRLGRKEGESLTNTGYLATFVIFASLTFAVALIVTAFYRKDFTFLYVAQNHPTDVSNLSWLYKLSGLWAGREGSLLLWAWLLSGFAAFMAYKRLSITDALSNAGLAVTNFIQLFFILALFIQTNNPFQTAIVAADGTVSNVAGAALGNINQMAMNPLLQHWAMVLHPPSLFIGYAGLAIPFAYALGAVFIGDSSRKWVDLVDRVTVFSWLFLGIGIGLGAIWAYAVLGWGGYWAWDPVESASLLPWLVGVGLIHSFTVYRRTGGFKRWAVVMSAAAFFFVLLGTFITRSGVIQSVHAFGLDLVSLAWFLTMMVAVVVVTWVALYARRKVFTGEAETGTLLSKDTAYYFNNVLMLFGAIVVASLTLAPVLGTTFSAPTYDLLARPIGILYIAGMAICPILSWRATDGATFWSRAKWPLAGAAVIAAGLLTIWVTVLVPNYQVSGKGLAGIASIQAPLDHFEALLGLLVAAFAVALPIYLFIDGARKRAAARDQGFGAALGSIFTKARTQSGGYLVHLGMGIVLIGLIGSAMYVRDVQFTLKDQPGASQQVGGYTLVLKSLDQKTLANGDAVQTAHVKIENRAGATVANLDPYVTVVAAAPSNSNRRLSAAVYSQPLLDVFTAFQGGDTTGLSFDVKINPLISWVWGGFVILIMGTALAAWPKREPEPVAVKSTHPAKKKRS